MLCKANSPNQKVYTISDGKQERCFVVVHPQSSNNTVVTASAKPIVFFAHGSGGNAANCGLARDLLGKRWTDIADENDFIFVCGEAKQYTAYNNISRSSLKGGLWEIPEVFKDGGSQNCDHSDSFDNVYMSNLIAKLNEEPDVYDTSRFFITGCSMGSAFTVWQAPCLHASDPSSFTAFSTHSTGLKIKGDGLKFPPDFYNPEYTWGECPECQYWPTLVKKVDGLKACVFDNTGGEL